VNGCNGVQAIRWWQGKGAAMASGNGSAESIVQVQNVAQRYGRKPVLRRVTLQVNAGEVVALLGANGAGKTTLLRILSGLDRPERGQV